MLARILSRRSIAEGTWLLEILPVNNMLEYIPGQFVSVALINPPYTDNRGNSRYLGLVNPPSPDNSLSVVYRDGPSAFKRFLSSAPPGTQVEISTPKGNLILPSSPDQSLTYLVGGIGIVPVISQLRFIQASAEHRPIALIYSNTTCSRALFLSELGTFAAGNPEFKFIPVITRDSAWSGETRRLSQTVLSELISDFANPQFFVIGTPRFVPDQVKSLGQIGVSQNRIKFEIFSGY